MPAGSGPTALPLRIVFLPGGWEHRVSSSATLLDSLGSPLLFWSLAAVLLAGALALVRRRPLLGVALAACATFCLGIAANGLVDDSYIQFRYAANFAAGHGPVFNPGERIEGASGGIWIGILGGLGALTGWDVASIGRSLSLVLAPLATAAAGLAGAALAGPEAGALAAILWAAFPTASMYAATGLETSAFALALFLFAAAAKERTALACVAGAAIATLRPEGVILGVAALPFLSRMPRAARRGVVSLLAASALIAAARLAYYGLPFPRSALVKGVTAAAGPAHGLSYLGSAALEWLPLGAGFFVLARGRSRLVAALAPVVLWTVLVVARGGDWMPGSRYLLPLAVLLALALAAEAPRIARPLAAAAVVFALVQLAPISAPSTSVAGRGYREMEFLRMQSRWWESFGTWLGRSVPPGTTLASGPSGAIAYASRLPVFDMYGLCSVVTEEREGLPGHRAWGLADAAAMRAPIVYPGEDVPQGGPWDEVAAAALAAVRTVPDFPRDYRPVALSHAPEYWPDILTDVLWFRRDVPLPGAGSSSTPAR